MRVAIYARVSTADKGQDPENQLRELGLGLWTPAVSSPGSMRSAGRAPTSAAIRGAVRWCGQEEIRLHSVLGAGSIQPRGDAADHRDLQRL